jgi:hypothetical protein
MFQVLHLFMLDVSMVNSFDELDIENLKLERRLSMLNS